MGFTSTNRFGYSISLPILGKTYDIPSPDYDTGMWLTETVTAGARIRAALDKGEDVPDDAVAALHLDGDNEVDFYTRCLGTALAEMRANKVPLEAIKLAAATVVIWVTQDRVAAEKYWNADGRADSPKAPADRKPKTTKKPSPRT